jgi:hypothetical protein
MEQFIRIATMAETTDHIMVCPNASANDLNISATVTELVEYLKVNQNHSGWGMLPKMTEGHLARAVFQLARVVAAHEIAQQENLVELGLTEPE